MVSGFAFRVPGYRVLVSGYEFRIPGFGFGGAQSKGLNLETRNPQRETHLTNNA
jgi:hypothetical protein